MHAVINFEPNSPTGQYKLSVDILLYLTKVPRFEMNAMFLGPIEKEGERHYSDPSFCFLLRYITQIILYLSFQI